MNNTLRKVFSSAMLCLFSFGIIGADLADARSSSSSSRSSSSSSSRSSSSSSSRSSSSSSSRSYGSSSSSSSSSYKPSRPTYSTSSSRSSSVYKPVYKSTSNTPLRTSVASDGSINPLLWTAIFMSLSSSNSASATSEEAYWAKCGETPKTVNKEVITNVASVNFTSVVNYQKREVDGKTSALRNILAKDNVNSVEIKTTDFIKSYADKDTSGCFYMVNEVKTYRFGQNAYPTNLQDGGTKTLFTSFGEKINFALPDGTNFDLGKKDGVNFVTINGNPGTDGKYPSVKIEVKNEPATIDIVKETKENFNFDSKIKSFDIQFKVKDTEYSFSDKNGDQIVTSFKVEQAPTTYLTEAKFNQDASNFSRDVVINKNIKAEGNVTSDNFKELYKEIVKPTAVINVYTKSNDVEHLKINGTIITSSTYPVVFVKKKADGKIYKLQVSDTEDPDDGIGMFWILFFVVIGILFIGVVANASEN